MLSNFYATVGGGRWNQPAAIYAVVGGGYHNYAGGDAATVGGGLSNQASASKATVGGGGSNQASKQYATISGECNNQANNSYATIPAGFQATATHHGELAYASGSFSATPGLAQTSQYVLRNNPADANPISLFLDGASSRLTIALGRTLTFDALVVARSDTGDSAGYHIWGMIENVDGTTQMVASGSEVLGENAASWDTEATADDTTDALDIKVTGSNGVNIRWVAFVRTVEVAW